MSLERRRIDVKQRILVSFVLSIGLVLCLVNSFYLVHIVDIQPLPSNVVKTRVLSNKTYSSLTVGKERLLEMLHDAGIYNITADELQQLPTWNQVVSLYGDEPKIVGLETCTEFQSSIDAAERLLAPAGVFNSGTNLLAELLLKNCVLHDRKKKYKRGTGIRWQGMYV